MQNTEKNSHDKKHARPSAADYGQVTDLVLQMQTDFDNGLRMYQEAIHYSIGVIATTPEEELNFTEKKENVEFLVDLCHRLRQIEILLVPNGIAHA